METYRDFAATSRAIEVAIGFMREIDGGSVSDGRARALLKHPNDNGGQYFRWVKEKEAVPFTETAFSLYG